MKKVLVIQYEYFADHRFFGHAYTFDVSMENTDDLQRLSVIHLNYPIITFEQSAIYLNGITTP